MRLYIALLILLLLSACKKEDYREAIIGKYSGIVYYSGMGGTSQNTITLDVGVDDEDENNIIIYNDFYAAKHVVKLNKDYTLTGTVFSGSLFKNDSLLYSCNQPGNLGTTAASYYLKKQ